MGYGDCYLQFNLGLPAESYDAVIDYLSSHWLIKETQDGICKDFEYTAKSLHLPKITCVFLLEPAGTPGNFDYIFTGDDRSFLMENWQKITAVEWDKSLLFSVLKTIEDMFSICGMLDSDGVLDDNSQSERIVFREDVYHYLAARGFTDENA